jgi:hypothetical protein
LRIFGLAASFRTHPGYATLVSESCFTSTNTAIVGSTGTSWIHKPASHPAPHNRLESFTPTPGSFTTAYLQLTPTTLPLPSTAINVVQLRLPPHPPAPRHLADLLRLWLPALVVPPPAVSASTAITYTAPSHPPSQQCNSSAGALPLAAGVCDSTLRGETTNS